MRHTGTTGQARFAWIGLLALGLLASATMGAEATPQTQPGVKPFELKDGDRVLMIGGTFMERESQLGYIETMLTSRFPDRNVTFRNLGYAGDTVGAEARRICQGWAVFGGPDEGFNRLKKLVEEIKPTVVVAAYGMGESFAGEAGLPEFMRKYNRLLDMMATAGGASPQFILIGPNPHEDMGRPLPDPAEHNKQLKAYSAAVERIANERGGRFVNLLDGLKPDANADAGHLTEDGIHLTPFGYLNVARTVGTTLFGESIASVELDAAGKVLAAQGAKVTGVEKRANGFSFTVTPHHLQVPRAAGSRGGWDAEPHPGAVGRAVDRGPRTGTRGVYARVAGRAPRPASRGDRERHPRHRRKRRRACRRTPPAHRRQERRLL